MARASQLSGTSRAPVRPSQRATRAPRSQTSTAAHVPSTITKKKVTTKEIRKVTTVFDPVYREDPLPTGIKEKLVLEYNTEYDTYKSSGDESDDPPSDGDEDARRTKYIIKTYSERQKARPTRHLEYSNDSVKDKKEKRNFLTNYDREVALNLMHNNVSINVISDAFGVSKTTLYRTFNRYQETGVLFLEEKQGGPKPHISKLHRWAIRCWIKRDAQVQLSDLQTMLIQAFRLKVSKATVYRAVRDMRFSHKVSGISTIRRNSEKTKEYRAKYAEILQHLIGMGYSNNIYYIDKSSFSSSMRSNYGWFPTNEKDGTIVKEFARGTAYSMVALLGPKGLEMYQMIQGSHNGETFDSYLQLVISHITKIMPEGNAVIILDNASIHKVEAIKNLVDWIDVENWVQNRRNPDKKIQMLFLPPYSPFLNPIEEVFGWIKRAVKRQKPNCPTDLFNMLHVAVKDLSPELTKQFYDHAAKFIPKSLAKKDIK